MNATEHTCPLHCMHSVTEHADTWFITRMLLPVCLIHEEDLLMSCIKLRQELWTVHYRGVTMPMILSAQFFQDRVTQAKLFNVSKMLKWIKCDIDVHPKHPFQELWTIFKNNERMIKAVHRQVFRWITLLQSKDVEVYFDHVEQVGLRSIRSLQREEEIDCGQSVLIHIGARSRRIYDLGVRWSTLENSYFGGGPSLINHACRDHANVEIDYFDGTVIAIDNILCGDALRADYGEDVGILFHTRGVKCFKCF